MPKNEQMIAAVEDLRAEFAQAKQREAELAREASDLPNRIKEAARAVVTEKASAARAGGALLAVAAESEVDELRSRQDNIDYESWAAKLHRAELAVQLHKAEEQAAALEVPDAESAHSKAEAAVEDAKAEEGRTYVAKMRAYGKLEVARKGKKDAEREISALEGQYPGA